MSLSSELEDDPPMRTFDRPNDGEGGDNEAEFSRRLDQVREENLVATGALVRCQGLLSSFNRPDVRKAFLAGKFVSGDCKAMLDSIDIIRDITLPHPFISSGLPLVASDALDFVSKLLSKHESEPLDGLQRHLPHRQSFGQWRELFSELQRQPIWRYFNDDLQVVDRPSSSRQNRAENLKRERQAKFRSAGRVVPENTSDDDGSTTSGNSRESRYSRKRHSTPVKWNSTADSTISTSDDSASEGSKRRRKKKGTKDELVDALKQLRFPKEVVAPIPFDPTSGESLSRFFKSFERYFDSRYDGTEKEKSFQLGKFLRGSAKRAYDVMGGSSMRYKKLKPKLLDWFRSERISHRKSKEEEFRAATMHPEDSCVIYCLRLENLAEAAFPSLKERERNLRRKVRETVPAALSFQIESAQGMRNAFGDGKMSWNNIKKLAESHDKLRKRQAEQTQPRFGTGEAEIFHGFTDRVVEAKGSSQKWSPSKTFHRNVPDRNREWSRCDYCGRNGHSVQNCRKRNGECFICGHKGHFANQCPNRESNRPRLAVDNQNQPSIWRSRTDTATDGSPVRFSRKSNEPLNERAPRK